LFIRDFCRADFMADGQTPYTVLVMDKDLSVEKYYRGFWENRQALVKKIYDAVGLADRRLRTCHGMQVLNAKVLKSLKEDFLPSRNWQYKDLIAFSPYEFTWYNAWFQKCGLVREFAVEPFFKTFHMREEYAFSRLKLIKEQDLAKAYVGIVLQSNWQKGGSLRQYEDPGLWHGVFYKILKKLY
jgi:hypothetical protein